MPIQKRIIKYLKDSNIKFEEISHKTVYTALDKAATLRVKPDIICKTLILKAGKDYITVSIPGNKNLDKNKIKGVLNSWLKRNKLKLVKSISFTTESWMKDNLKSIKVGAMPIFGDLYHMMTIIDSDLVKKPKIVINGGNYENSIKISGKLLKKFKSLIIIDNISKKR